MLSVPAFAKVNLDLRILSRRADGYHELATVFQTIDLHDTVTIRPRDGHLRVICDAPGVPADATNLAWRAALATWRAAGRPGEPAGFLIEIHKRIPARAGLGGGSADAAAALVAVDRYLELGLAPERRLALSRELGADVAFFLTGGTAEGRGRGDEIRPLPDLPPLTVVLLLPDFGVETAAAYRWHDEDGARPSSPGAWPEDAAGWKAVLARCRNDLAGPVVARHPQIGDLVERLQAAGARLAGMSGSGSAVFGLFDEPESVERARRSAASAGVRCLETATLARVAYRQALGLAVRVGDRSPL